MGVQLLCMGNQDKMQTVRAANFCVSLILLIFSQISLIQAQGDCERGQVCKKLRECDEAAELLSEAENTFDDVRKNQIINLLRNRVCGRRTERTICCAQESSSSAESSDNGLRKLGSFRNIFHDIGGDAYAVDESTILIKGFTYDGEGPDPFFWQENLESLPQEENMFCRGQLMARFMVTMMKFPCSLTDCLMDPKIWHLNFL